VSAAYVVRRVLLFFVVVWAATTLIFFLPKMAPGRNPVVERIGMMMATGGVNTGNLASYLALPSVLAVGGSWMVAPELLAAGDWAAVTRLTAAAVAAARA